LANSPQDSIFFKVDCQSGVVGSVRTAQPGFETVWTYNLDQGQEIIDYSYHLKGVEDFLKKAMKGSMITIPEEEALYYKIVDPGNLGSSRQADHRQTGTAVWCLSSSTQPLEEFSGASTMTR
jgi:hypothetical protein